MSRKNSKSKRYLHVQEENMTNIHRLQLKKHTYLEIMNYKLNLRKKVLV